MTATRRLAAILAADVVGYSRLIGADEPGTLARLRAVRGEVIDPLLATHGGRVFKSMGDGLLAEFPSGVQAIECAVAVQQALAARADGLQLRIGLHSADVVVQPDGDLLGDGVNVAARLEALAEPGCICLSDRVREDAAGKLSLDLEDLGERELKNIARKVRVFRVRLATEPKPLLALPDKPSLAVLPFTNLSGDVEQEYFADGVVEDIITALSRTGWLFVIARNSSFSYKGKSPDIRNVGRELGVRYVLEGSVRRAGGRVRITCQLIEAATGGHVWADRFEGDLADIFELQDRITESVVGAIEPNLQRAEIARASAKPTESLDAYDLYLRALQQFYLFTEPGNQEARRLLRQAMSMDTRFGLAKALAAWCAWNAVNQEWIAWGGPEFIEAIAFGRSALADSPDNPSVLRLAGSAVGFLAHDLDIGRAALDRAVTLNANSAQILGSSGWFRVGQGEFEVARNHFTRAMRLSPLDSETHFFQTGLAVALVLGEPAEPERGLDVVRKALIGRPNLRTALHAQACCLVKLGRLEEAKGTARQFLAIWPHFTLSEFRRRTPFCAQVADTIIGLLRRAGFPE
jgi:adenylate cyclase